MNNAAKTDTEPLVRLFLSDADHLPRWSVLRLITGLGLLFVAGRHYFQSLQIALQFYVICGMDLVLASAVVAVQ